MVIIRGTIGYGYTAGMYVRKKW